MWLDHSRSAPAQGGRSSSESRARAWLAGWCALEWVLIFQLGAAVCGLYKRLADPNATGYLSVVQPFAFSAHRSWFLYFNRLGEELHGIHNRLYHYVRPLEDLVSVPAARFETHIRPQLSITTKTTTQPQRWARQDDSRVFLRLCC